MQQQVLAAEMKGHEAEEQVEHFRDHADHLLKRLSSAEVAPRSDFYDQDR